MKKVYIAGQMENRLILNYLRLYLQSTYSFIVTSGWLDRGICSLKEASKMDFGGIDRSDFVLCTYPTGYGSCSEISYSIARNKPVIYYVDNEYLPDFNNKENTKDFKILPVGLLNKWEGTYNYWEHDYNPEYYRNKFNPGFIITNSEDLDECLSRLKHI